MTDYLRTPDTPADTLRDTLLGALVGLARSTSSEPKTENTDAVLNAGLRLAAQCSARRPAAQAAAAAGRVPPGRTAPGCRRAAGHLPGPVRLFRGLGRRTSGPGDRTDRKALPPVKSARRTRRIYPICFSPKYKTVSDRKSLISAGKPEFPVPGRLPERFFALQILFPAGFARFFWKKALQTNRKKLLYK